MRKALLTAGLLLVAGSTWPHQGPGVFGLGLGQASMSEVLARLGPAEAAYLAGSNTDEGPRRGDPVVLRFLQDYQLVDRHSSEMLAFFDPETFRLMTFVVRFERAVPSAEVKKRFGDRFQEIRQRLILFPGGEEGELRPCHDPSGTHASLVFEELGLQAELDDTGAVAALRFTPTLSVEAAFPPCEGEQLETP